MTAPTRLDPLLAEVRGLATRRGGDWAEVYAEAGAETTAELRAGAVRIAFRPATGVAVRTREGRRSTFGSTDGLSVAAVRRLVGELDPSGPGPDPWPGAEPGPAGRARDEREQRARSRRQAEHLLARLAAAAAERDLADVRADLLDRWRSFGRTGTDGVTATGRSAFAVLSVEVGTGRRRGRARIAVRGGAELGGSDPAELVAAALADARAYGAAEPPPSLSVPVVFAPTAAGVLIHEAVGHPLEGDTAGRSALWRHRGGLVSHPALDISEAAGSPQAWVPAEVDDEGAPCRTAPLVGAGTVVGLLTDRDTAAVLGGRSTGCARRSSYASPPSPRARHTVVAPGRDRYEDMLAGTGDGVLVEQIAAADADPARGRFTMRVRAGHRIRAGAPAEPLAAFTVSGELDDFRSLDAIGDRCEVDRMFCGKAGRWVPVSVASPALRFGRLAVHGLGRAS